MKNCQEQFDELLKDTTRGPYETDGQFRNSTKWYFIRHGVIEKNTKATDNHDSFSESMPNHQNVSNPLKSHYYAVVDVLLSLSRAIDELAQSEAKKSADYQTKENLLPGCQFLDPSRRGKRISKYDMAPKFVAELPYSEHIDVVKGSMPEPHLSIPDAHRMVCRLSWTWFKRYLPFDRR